MVSEKAISQEELKLDQTQIPFSSVNIYQNDLQYLEGFEIDSLGNYYILAQGSNHTTLTCLDGKKIIFQKKYPDFHFIKLHLVDDKLITCTRSTKNVCIYTLSLSTGNIIDKKTIKLSKKINAIKLFQGNLIVELLSNKVQNDFSTRVEYFKVNFEGKLIDEVKNGNWLFGDISDAPFDLNNKEMYASWLIGQWQEKIIFYYYEFESEDNVFVAYDSQNKNSRYYHLSNKLLSKRFYDPWNELIKIRNRKLFLVRYKNTDVIIYQMHLNDMFQNKRKP